MATIKQQGVTANVRDDKVVGTDVRGMVMELSPILNDQVSRIAKWIAPEALVHFIAKNYDYGDTADALGAQGQFAELWRKVGKLKKPMWDGGTLKFEQPREILMELIGHCYLAIDYLDKNDPDQQLLDD